MEECTTKRKENNYNYGLDLLRILSMLSIIGLHVVNAGGAFTNNEKPVIQYVWTIFYMVILSSVNVFAMLSGYLYAGKTNVRNKRIVNLLGETLFYYIGITTLFFFLFPDVIEISGMLQGLFPPVFGYNWYIVCYVFLFFCIPYINWITNRMPKRIFKKFLLLLFVLLSVIPTYGFADYFRTQYGYSPWWLIYCYMIGTYIKRHDVKISKNGTWTLVLSCFAFCAVLFGVSFCIFGEARGLSLVKEYTSPTTVVLATVFLCMFQGVRIPGRAEKTIKQLSGTSFGVYIIHAHPFVMGRLIGNRFSFIDDFRTLPAIAVVIVICVCIYLICSAIEIVRRFLFRILRLSALLDILGDKLDGLLWNDDQQEALVPTNNK